MKLSKEDYNVLDHIKESMIAYIKDVVKNEKYIEVKLSNSFVDVSIYIEGELTIAFPKYTSPSHSHYYYEDINHALDYVKEILSGKYLFVDLFYRDKWVRSKVFNIDDLRESELYDIKFLVNKASLPFNIGKLRFPKLRKTSEVRLFGVREYRGERYDSKTFKQLLRQQ